MLIDYHAQFMYAPFLELILSITQISEDITSSELPSVSLMIQTTGRNLKLKAPTREKHEMWFRVSGTIDHISTLPRVLYECEFEQ